MPPPGSTGETGPAAGSGLALPEAGAPDSPGAGVAPGGSDADDGLPDGTDWLDAAPEAAGPVGDGVDVGRLGNGSDGGGSEVDGSVGTGMVGTGRVGSTTVGSGSVGSGSVGSTTGSDGNATGSDGSAIGSDGSGTGSGSALVPGAAARLPASTAPARPASDQAPPRGVLGPLGARDFRCALMPRGRTAA
jgi:hypothetical protein